PTWALNIRKPVNTPNGLHLYQPICRNYCVRLKRAILSRIRTRLMTHNPENTLTLPPLIVPDWPLSARVRSCITTRGELQPGDAYASFNLALHVGDNPERVTQRRHQLCQQLGLARAPQWLEQVHGIRVVEAQ